MLGWLFVAPSERRVLGSEGARRPTPWVIAIMSFSMVIVAAAGLALAHSASMISASAASRYSVQVPGGAGRLAAIEHVLRSDPSVTNVEPVSESEMRKTLGRWLGPAASSRDLPVPALVNFDLREGADPTRLSGRVAAVAPGASIAAHRESLAPLLRSLRALQWLALGLVVLMTVAAASAVVLAARGALDTHRFTIDVMHGIGATDLQITHLFQRRIAIDALAGSFAGAAAAALVLLALIAGARFAGELTGGAGLGPSDALILLLLPLALTLIATFVGRAAVLSTLRSAL